MILAGYSASLGREGEREGGREGGEEGRREGERGEGGRGGR